MKRSVTFSFADGTGEMTGYEGSSLPVDKMAELVLSSGTHPIRMITVHYEAPNSTADWLVKWASDPLPGIPCKPFAQGSGKGDCVWSGQPIAPDGFCASHHGS